jgi:hypothetical protein
MTRKFRSLLLALALAAPSLAQPSAALAQSGGPAICAPYRELADALARHHGETLRFRAEDARGFALEFFAHDDGSWTLVMRHSGGDRGSDPAGDRACAIAAGRAWRERPLPDDRF